MCRQGETAVQIIIEQGEGGAISGTFAFSATPRYPRIPNGSFRFVGLYDPQERTMIGSPREWIEQPEGYTAAQFEGRLSSDGNGIEGQINAAGCRRFKVARGEISEQALEVTEPIDLRRLDSVGDLHTRCRVIYSWTLTLEREYPDLDLVGSLLRNIVPQAMNLFADEYMTELFGKPYDLLNQANRDSISRTFILPCFFRWSHKGIFTWQQKIIRTPFKRRIGGPFRRLRPLFRRTAKRVNGCTIRGHD